MQEKDYYLAFRRPIGHASRMAPLPALVPLHPTPAALPAQAETDAQLIALWLHGRSPATVRAYRADVSALLARCGRPLRAVTLGDVQAFADRLASLAQTSRARKLSAVKSLLAYAHRLGYTAFDVGAALRLPAVKLTLGERILSEADVQRLLALEPNPRNAALLRLAYGAGLRIAELCALAWRDLAPRDDAGQITLFGKGGKTRVVLLPASLWRTLVALRGDAQPDDPVFRSAKGSPLDPSAAHRIVKAAAARAGLPPAVSAHWLRHAHASHALDHGAPIHLVQATLGHASVATTGRYLHARPNDSSARYLLV
jgi:integrase/recombinase XerD